MKTGIWIRTLISGVVGSIALCAVLLFAGCSTQTIKGEQCKDNHDRTFAVLTALLSTCMGLAIKLDALDEPETKKAPSRTSARQ